MKASKKDFIYVDILLRHHDVCLFKYLYKNYNQNAYVFNIVHELPHNGMALERFFPTGPLAILPMKTTKGNQSSVVFTVDDDIR